MWLAPNARRLRYPPFLPNMKKIIFSVFLTLFLVALVMSWSHSGKLKKAHKIKISYIASIDKKEILVEDGEEVKKMLAALQVESTESHGRNFFKPNCTIQFIRNDGSYTEVFFEKPKHLHDQDEPREYFLKNTKFFDLVNELASKKERRKINVLTRNAAYGPPEPKKGSSVTIVYPGKRKRMEKKVLLGPDESAKLILAREVESTEQSYEEFNPAMPVGSISYTADNGWLVEQFFVTPTRLYESGALGAIYYELKNTKFYDLANEIASKAEGRKIDVLKDN